jgi:deoxyribose-phosphate aldolase
MKPDDARLIGMLDLTSLTGRETEADIVALCAKADGVAAVCVYGEWVPTAVRELEGRGIPVAAVANFPEGDLDPERARRDAVRAVGDGAAEVDVVLPWRAWLEGDREGALAVVRGARVETPGVLKVILESGSLGDATGEAARAALDAGADFVKTSTGKVGQGATLEAARAMLEAIRAAGHGGFKASGGVRTPEEAHAYLDLAEVILGPGWATRDTFRIGASSLLDALRDSPDR